MSRLINEKDRILCELRDRLGEEDPVVCQWQNDLDEKESFEFRYPTRLFPPPWVNPASQGSLLGLAC